MNAIPGKAIDINAIRRDVARNMLTNRVMAKLPNTAARFFSVRFEPSTLPGPA